MEQVDRRFKLVPKDRVIMALVYYSGLYITYTPTEFLFDLDQNNVCRDIEKIEGGLIRSCLPIPQKLYNLTKRLKTREEVEQYLPGFMAFVDCSEQPIPKPKNRKKRRLCIIQQARKRKRKKRKRMNKNQKRYQIVKNTLPRDGLSSVLAHGTTGLENCLQGMRKKQTTILDWYSSLAA